MVKLVTSPESYPVWYTLNPIVLPRHQLVHYKFCIMEGGTTKAFEHRCGMRIITVMIALCRITTAIIALTL